MAVRVLVVEDDELLRLLTIEAISLLGFKVTGYATADEALEALEASTDIALVLTDVRMPGRLDGLGLAQLVWARWPDIPVIITSSETDLPRESLPSNSLYLPKPCSIDELYEAIATLI